MCVQQGILSCTQSTPALHLSLFLDTIQAGYLIIPIIPHYPAECKVCERFFQKYLGVRVWIAPFTEANSPIHPPDHQKTAIKALLIPFLYMKIHFHFITDAVVLPVAITAIQGENDAIQAIPKETRRYGGKL